MNSYSYSRSWARASGAVFIGSVLGLVAVGCGAPPTNLPYGIDTTILIYPDGTTDAVATPNGDGCLDLAGVCVQPQTLCGSNDARVDLVLDSSDNVVEHVCYPIDESGVIVATDANTLANSPGEVVVIAEDAMISGNIFLNGDNTVVYGELDRDGNGVADDASTIVGDLSLNGADTIARGVRITGNLTLSGANTAALFVIVEGDVNVPGNGALLANSVVFGNVHYTGSNFDFVGNAVAGTVNATAAFGLCGDDVLFTDANQNLLLERPGELTGDYICP